MLEVQPCARATRRAARCRFLARDYLTHLAPMIYRRGQRERPWCTPLRDPPDGRDDVGIKLYHPGDAPEVTSDGEVRLLTPADKDRWSGPREYMAAAKPPCAVRGEAFGLFLGEWSVAEVMTHEPSVAEVAHLIAENGIEVAAAYRRRGYGKAVLAAWTREMQRRGRVCLHDTSLGNVASVNLACSLGYREYARDWSVNSAAGRERAGYAVQRRSQRRRRHVVEREGR